MSGRGDKGRETGTDGDRETDGMGSGVGERNRTTETD